MKVTMSWIRFYKSSAILFYFLAFAFLFASSTTAIIPKKYLGLFLIVEESKINALLAYYMAILPLVCYIILALYVKNKYLKILFIVLAIAYNIFVGSIIEAIASV